MKNVIFFMTHSDRRLKIKMEMSLWKIVEKSDSEEKMQKLFYVNKSNRNLFRN